MTQSEAIATRRLGNTDLQVSPIGLGAWQFSEGRGGATGIWASVTAEETDAIIKAALDGGINWFDTAEIYGFGRSERALARGLQHADQHNGDVIIATKWMPFLRTASSITSTIEARQQALAPFSIDLHQIHAPMSFSSIEAQMDAMADLVEAGAIKAVGVSNFSAEQMYRAFKRLEQRGIPLASNQVKYSLLDRSIETNGVLDAARAFGISIICYSPLEMGLLTGKFHLDPSLLSSRPLGRRMQLQRQITKTQPLIDVLREIAADHDASVSQVALSWLINAHGEMIVAIPGATKVRHAQESAGAMQVALNDDDIKRIDQASRSLR